MPYKIKFLTNDFVHEGDVLPMVWVRRYFVDTPEEAAARERVLRQVRRKRAHEAGRYAKRIARRYGPDDPRAVWARWVAWSRAHYDNFPVEPRTRVQALDKLAAARKRAVAAAIREQMLPYEVHASVEDCRTIRPQIRDEQYALIEGAWDAYRRRRKLKVLRRRCKA